METPKLRKGIDHIGITASFIVYDRKGRMLLGKRSEKCRDEHHRWCFGGGSVKMHERLEETIRREIREEYNLEISQVDFLGHREIFRIQNNIPTHWISFQFMCRVDDITSLRPNDTGEIVEFQWVTLDTLPPEEVLHSQLSDMIAEFEPKIREILAVK